MNTFLPFEDFKETAKVLDSLRMNTCINEALVILRSLSHVYPVKERTGLSGFEGHTLGRFWKGHELQLARYGLALAREFFDRGVAHSIAVDSFNKRKKRLQDWTSLVEYMEDEQWADTTPPMVGDAEFHSGMRAFLLYKDAQAETYKKWKAGEYPDHAVTRNLLPKKSSWKRDDYIRIWEFFGRPDGKWYTQWNWEEEPDDMRFFYLEDKRPQMSKEIERKELRPVVSFLRR